MQTRNIKHNSVITGGNVSPQKKSIRETSKKKMYKTNRYYLTNLEDDLLS